MRKQLSVSLSDFRYVCIECPRCKTRVILDMKNKAAFAVEHGFFTPRDCPACKTPYDSAVRPNIDQLQRAYEALFEIADRITFLGEPDEENAT